MMIFTYRCLSEGSEMYEQEDAQSENIFLTTLNTNEMKYIG